MREYLWFSYEVTVVAIVLVGLLFKECSKRSADHLATEGGANNDAAVLDGTAAGRPGRDIDSALVKKRTATSLSGYDYEVFLSFRGPDTRAGIVDFLYTSLIDAGIHAYRDDKDLRFGEEMGPELVQAIHQSKISIPVFSSGYASSRWCLQELAHMVKCKKTRGQIIMPIFYNVAPREVRLQSGVYGRALSLHETQKRYGDETIREWKEALKETADLKGWDLSMPNRYEGEVVKEVVKKVFRVLKKANLEVSDCLVGVDYHAGEIMQMIGARMQETQIVGIHGMGGVGKTTLAKIIYNQLLDDFEDCCFLSNIRESSELHGIEWVLNQLISDVLKQKWTHSENSDEGIKMIKERLSRKKVLLLLDDVDKKIQLNVLMGKRDWFGEGSKILITTRNRDILNNPELDFTYDLTCMELDQSIQLFSRHAFRRDYPSDEYVTLSHKAVDIAGGLPLALEVIGSLLSSTSKERWDAKLKKLERTPHPEVQSRLKVSYDVLDDRQKHIFLDIACFFIGCDIETVIHAWDDSEFFQRETIEVLQDMSLIKIQKDKKLWMHNQLRDLGREITSQECDIEKEKQRRVWNPEKALNLLMTREEKEVHAICFKLDSWLQYHFTYEDFSRLSNLRYLQVDSLNLQKDLGELLRADWRLNMRDSLVEISLLTLHMFTFTFPYLPGRIPFRKRSMVLPKLRWFSWHNYPSLIDITKFSCVNLAVLDLSESKLTECWAGWRHLKMAKNLKVLNLTGCTSLKRIPHLSRHVNLERLILEKCESLVKISKSIGRLQHLVLLNLNFCKKLSHLPEEINNMTSLRELLIDGTSIRSNSNTPLCGSSELNVSLSLVNA